VSTGRVHVPGRVHSPWTRVVCTELKCARKQRWYIHEQEYVAKLCVLLSCLWYISIISMSHNRLLQCAKWLRFKIMTYLKRCSCPFLDRYVAGNLFNVFFASRRVLSAFKVRIVFYKCFSLTSSIGLPRVLKYLSTARVANYSSSFLLFKYSKFYLRLPFPAIFF